MNLIEMLKTILYGVVEGITEWLPISSTGHMLLLQQFLPLDVTADFWDMFLVVIQLGAILAVCVIFFKQLNPFMPSKTADERRQTWSLWGKTIVACIPAAAIGIPLDDWVEAHLGSPFVIAAALIVYGIAFICIETAHGRKAAALAPVSAPKHLARASSEALSTTECARITELSELDWRCAIGIGIFQVLSIVPGTSRSGSTIIGGLILGCSRAVAAEFTFFLAIPVMVGASGLRLAKYFLKGNVFTPTEATTLLVGCATAFVVSLLVVRFLMSFVRKHDFKPFGVYRIVLGVVTILYFALLA